MRLRYAWGIGIVLAILASACQPATTLPPAATAYPAPLPATDTPDFMPTDGGEEVYPAPDETQNSQATPEPTYASVFPNPDAYQWREVASGLTHPSVLTHANDDSSRIYIVEQPGRIRVLDNGALVREPFLDIQSKVYADGNEQGLLGLAFPPDFVNSQRFYINYTGKNGQTVISRYNVINGLTADAASEEILLTVAQPFSNHNGGQLAFGLDGYLYIGLGDGGSGGDPQGNGQNTQTLLGKILRIDVSPQKGYLIPSGNPFAAGGGAPEIWAFGLRNPWTFSFDPQTGNLFIADVGQNKYEEIDMLRADEGGANLGWNLREGLHAFAGDIPTDTQLVDPIYEYAHDQGCSVTGGSVYRGSTLPSLRGVYLFGDYCSGTVSGLIQMPNGTWQAQQLWQVGVNISGFGVDSVGEIYLLDHQGGSVLQLVAK